MASDFLVGGWHVQPDLNRVSNDSRSTQIEPKAMEVLVFLARHAGQMVTRTQLLEHVWEGTSVSDEVLTHSISLLRRVLEDDARNPRVIETISRKGYRLMVPVRPVETAAVPQPGRPRAMRRHLLTAAAVVGLLAAGYGLRWLLTPGASAPPVRSLAVLPLKNLSGSPAEEYLSDGLTDELVTTLGRLADIRVVSFQSTLRFKGTSRPVSEVGKQLGVDAVVTGAVLRSNGSVRVTVQLVDSSTDRILWTGEGERAEDDLISLHRDVANRLAQGIQAKLHPSKHGPPPDSRRPNSEAYAIYLQGRFLLNKWEAATNERAAEHFRRALALDPTFAPAWAGLSDALTHMAGMNRLPMQILPEAKSAALRALELDESLSEAHASLGHLLYLVEWDWAGAEREFRRALELNPNRLYAHLHFNPLLVALGRVEEGIAHARAAALLDPTTPTTLLQLSWTLRMAGRFDEALKVVSEAEELEPENWRVPYYRALIRLQLRHLDDATAELARALERSPENPRVVAAQARADALAGRRDAALDRLRALEAPGARSYVDPELIARAYSCLGMKEPALTWLERATDQHSPNVFLLNVSDEYTGLRSEARFRRILDRLNLPLRHSLRE